MSDFLEFFEETKKWCPMHLDISYSVLTDWTINIYQKANIDGYDSLTICTVQSKNKEYAFAKAQVELKDWLTQYRGGY